MRTINVLLILTILTFISCNSDNFEEHRIGSDLIEETADVVLIDTLEVESSTVILDSLVTSGFNNVILGGYSDEFFGDVRSDYYGVVSLNGEFTRSPITGSEGDVPIRFDSLVFMAYTNREYFGDTLLPQRLIINRLSEAIELPDDETAFYAHSKFDFDEIPLLDAEFYLNPVKQPEYDADIDSHLQDDNANVNYYGKYYGEGIFIKMDSEEAIALGEEIVELVNTESDTVLETITWQKYIKGIVIRPGENNTAMFQVPLADNKLKIRLYYSDTDYEDAGVAKYHDFPIAVSGPSESYSFTNYYSDRSSTPQQLDRLIEQEVELSSDDTDELVFVQGGIGIYTKLNFPYIENLNTLGLTGGILGAELIIYPKEGSYDDEIFFAPFAKNSTPSLVGENLIFTSDLTVYTTNENNVVGAPLASTATNSVLRFNFIQNQNNKDESYYSTDLTAYVNDLLVNGKDFDDALLIGIPFENIGNSYDRLVIEDDFESDFRIKLRVSYVIQR